MKGATSSGRSPPDDWSPAERGQARSGPDHSSPPELGRSRSWPDDSSPAERGGARSQPNDSASRGAAAGVVARHSSPAERGRWHRGRCRIVPAERGRARSQPNDSSPAERRRTRSRSDDSSPGTAGESIAQNHRFVTDETATGRIRGHRCLPTIRRRRDGRAAAPVAYRRNHPPGVETAAASHVELGPGHSPASDRFVTDETLRYLSALRPQRRRPGSSRQPRPSVTDEPTISRRQRAG